MSMEKEIEKLHKAYEAAEGDNREETIAALASLHATADKGDAKVRQAFYTAASQACGGCYVPYLFWTALARFYETPDTRTELADLLHAFVAGDFEAQDLQLMKPLIVVYFAKEKPFEVDKLRAKLLTGAHPSVKTYFDTLAAFIENNKVAVQTYRDKFALVRDRRPDFELFSQPLTRLEEELG
jgi:hypothetical protein